MARNAGNGRISASPRRVLELLANAPRGRSDPNFIALFTIELLELVEAGLVDAQAEAVTEGSRTTETVRVRITAAGQRALEG
jgi:hypothetical protein